MMQKLYIIILLLVSVNLSAKSIATVSALKGSAEIKRNTQILEAKVTFELEEKDIINTIGNSKMQIIFLDETILTIGKKSSFSIEEYLYEENTEPVAKFGMLEGAVRVITGGIGKIAPNKFSVKTKTATIGIRGTNFTAITRANGSFRVFCTYGAISTTFNSNTYIVKQGYYMNISPSGEIEVKPFNADELRDMKKEHFASKEAKKEDSTKVNNEFISFEESNQRLDVQFKDEVIIIQDIIDTTPDYIAKDLNGPTDDAVIASYSMQEAQYRGKYTSDYSTGSLYESGDAAMTINFGEDTAWLGFGSFADPKEQARFNFTDVTTSQIKGTQEGNIGVATGNFYTQTGNAITGEFEFGETTAAGVNEITAKGTYDVSSSLTLE